MGTKQGFITYTMSTTAFPIQVNTSDTTCYIISGVNGVGSEPEFVVVDIVSGTAREKVLSGVSVNPSFSGNVLTITIPAYNAGRIYKTY